ncbi:hypothetical protein [Fidelibacter multiformis]|uniref:hypothetical protein n=1 Tax=Fidelibacter multiformis TaxID=3377529 RepID=UPI0037DD4A63
MIIFSLRKVNDYIPFTDKHTQYYHAYLIIPIILLLIGADIELFSNKGRIKDE